MNGPLRVFAIPQESLDFLQRTKIPQLATLLQQHSDFAATYATTGEVEIHKTRRTPQPAKQVSRDQAAKILWANANQAGFVSLDDIP